MSSLQTDHVAINEPNSTTTLRAEIDIIKGLIMSLTDKILEVESKQ